jgi:hypothetical protein
MGMFGFDACFPQSPAWLFHRSPLHSNLGSRNALTVIQEE